MARLELRPPMVSLRRAHARSRPLCIDRVSLNSDGLSGSLNVRYVVEALVHSAATEVLNFHAQVTHVLHYVEEEPLLILYCGTIDFVEL